MSYIFGSKLGEQLYQLLPEVYRTRDKKSGQAVGGSGTEDLAGYLDAHGHLLDLIHATLEQQLKDALPGSSQDWLLPYFAQLLAANIVSPDSEGKHAEIANAVSWRQRKGTLKCVEEIAEAVGQMEVEIQEGWKRVAMTPRIGMPIIPAKAIDAKLKNIDKNTPPSEAARHPTLPAAMVDLRRPSRAVKADSTNPAARTSTFAGVSQTWRQVNHHGVPCFPGSFEDVSRRTVDIRTPDLENGHYHHKRLLAYAPPPVGFFGLDSIPITWDGHPESLPAHLIEVKEGKAFWFIRNNTGRVIEVTDANVTLDVSREVKAYRIEGLNFQGELNVPDGGTLELSGVEAQTVRVDTSSTDNPVLTATDCLFNTLSVGSGLARLDSCTVLGIAHITALEALDSILMAINGHDITGEIAYSRIPGTEPLSDDLTKMSIKSHHLNEESEYGYDPVIEDPSFIPVSPGMNSLAARAVLSPNAPKLIYEGASDGGEMGYYHHGRKGRPVRIAGNLSLAPPADGGYPLADLIFVKDVVVTAGQLVLNRCAAPGLNVETPLNKSGEVKPSLLASDCLFQSINVLEGLARLEYCTIMQTANCKHLQASDCIFAGSIEGVIKQDVNSKVNAFMNCLRYSSIPSKFLEGIKEKPENRDDKKQARALQLIDREGRLTLRTNTLQRPLFDKYLYCKDSQPKPREADYGEPGYGVLDPVTSDAIRFGAEDGGEMGAYHHKYYSLKAEAVLDKMREFLPVGIEPVLIRDSRLLREPPEQKISEESTGNGGES